MGLFVQRWKGAAAVTKSVEMAVMKVHDIGAHSTVQRFARADMKLQPVSLV